MKHPNRDAPDQINRLNAAEEPTIIIGADDSSQDTVLAPQTKPQPQQEQPQPQMSQPIHSSPEHTTILRPVGAPDDLQSDPVVGWLVVLSGPGRGQYRAIFSGSNTIGRSSGQRIPINFGDDAISSEKQAFLVYDGRKRQYQLVPNLERPNLVHLNDSALLANGELNPHDKITMGNTTLLFVPLCGADFDWSDVK